MFSFRLLHSFLEFPPPPTASYLLAGTSRAWGLLRPGGVIVLSRMLDPRKIPLCSMTHLGEEVAVSW